MKKISTLSLFIFCCTFLHAQVIRYSAPILQRNPADYHVVGEVNKKIIVFNAATISATGPQIYIYDDRMKLVKQVNTKQMLVPRNYAFTPDFFVNPNSFFTAYTYKSDTDILYKVASYDEYG